MTFSNSLTSLFDVDSSGEITHLSLNRHRDHRDQMPTLATDFLTKLRKWDGDMRIFASYSVLNTYELLENILSHLQPSDLRQARLVSRSWQAVVARSHSLDRVSKQFGDNNFLRQVNLLLFGDRGVGKDALIKQASCILSP